MIIYNELKKRNLINDEKEFSELIWLKQIKVNGDIIHDPSIQINNIKKIKIGILEFNLD